MSRIDDLYALVAEYNKKQGAGSMVLASQIRNHTPRFTSGSLGLDIILGGGWPANQWIELIGDESSGKTALALKTVAANQEKDPDFTTIWIAAERWVSDYAAMCGVDMDRVAVVETSDMETAYASAVKFADSRSVDCIVIDSLPALVPSAEDEKDMEGSTIGRGAILTGRFFRKVGKATKRSLVEVEQPVLGIVINQWRQKIGVMYGDSRTTPGGLAKNYAYAVRVEIRRGGWIETGVGSHKSKVGQTIQIRTIKNKTYPPQRTAAVDFYFGVGGTIHPGEYDTAKEVAAIAVMHDLITRAGSIYQYDGIKWKGQESMLQSIREDVDLYERIHREVMDVYFKAIR